MDYDSRRDHTGHYSCFVLRAKLYPVPDELCYVGEADDFSSGFSLLQRSHCHFGDKVYIVSHASYVVSSDWKDCAYCGLVVPDRLFHKSKTFKEVVDRREWFHFGNKEV